MTARGRATLALLAGLPLLALAPGWWEGRLLGPGDGAALHYPLRALVWEAYRHGEFPAWNHTVFLGTPLLASYRPGALYPPMAALTLLPPFLAFQVLVVGSLGLAGIFTYLYLRRLGAGLVGAYVAGLSFSLGPYLIGHLGDTPTVVAAPLLPLLLLAAEAHLRKDRPGRSAGLAATFALLLLAGSPEAARAGATLLFVRLLLGHLRREAVTPPRRSLLAVAAGLLLAAPQLVPTLILATEAGRPLTGLAERGDVLPGATGLVLRYVSHTPAPSLAVAALPLALSNPAVRVHAAGLALVAALQWGRGPLAAAGALPLLFDFALATLGGLSLSAQWQARREPLGRRLRIYFLFACLASSAALSVAAAALGPLPQTLTGPVGVLALALILYHAQASAPHAVTAGLWLLPLTVSFLLQPYGRRVLEETPTAAQLQDGSATRQAVDRAMGALRRDRLLTLVRDWPHGAELDLAYANLSSFADRQSANGYDPMVAMSTRRALGSMGVGGMLPGAFFRADPLRLGALGVRWVQLPAAALTGTEAGASGLGDPLDLEVRRDNPRLFPLPISAATEVRLGSWLADAVDVEQDAVVAWLDVRLASGRTLPLPVRAGVHTSEWAWERKDVRERVRHQRGEPLESWNEAGFRAHHYLATVPLPGRYFVESVGVRAEGAQGRFHLARVALFDAATDRVVPVSLASAFVSDTAHFREAVSTPLVRLFELPNTLGRARVLKELRVLPDEGSVLQGLGSWTRQGLDPRDTALGTAADAEGITLPPGARSSRADVTRLEGSHVDVRAEGPGLLVVTTAADRGWSATLDGKPTRILRVNGAEIAVPLPGGGHRVALQYSPRGLGAGLALAAAAALGLAFRARRQG